uniref:Uncharacterized protein LOC100368900 n=1 Tax=Saccoglossus kowalevskii TaxID=10224 RepID=A0ABM0GUJ4_SACKO|nr:PREDICTED: uncharacterized protein LOC100368900 [Saccoglossus kowalevskii]
MEASLLQVILLTLSLYAVQPENYCPKGHLQPLGGHRPPDVPIDETDIPPHPRTFWEKYVKHGKPLILRGAMKHSPGFNLWTTQYLKEKYGDLEIRLEGKVERGYGSQIPAGVRGLGRDTIGNFIDTYQKVNKYIVSQLPTAMYPEVMVPPSMQCGTFKDSLVEIDIWMSAGNSKSALHKDAFNTWNCLVSGTKQWKMVENKYEPLIYRSWEPERAIGGISLINVSSVDMIKHPNIAKVRWSNFTIHAGDCLYLPRSYYHQVTSFGDPNIAVALLFSRMTDFDDTGCDNAELKYTPLSDMIVTWNWSGHGTMTMGHMDHRSIIQQFLKAADTYGQLKIEHLEQEIALTIPEEDLDFDYVKTPFDILDKDKKGYLTKEDILKLDIDVLREFIQAMEGVEPSNTDHFEYSHIELHIVEELDESKTRERDEKLLIFRDDIQYELKQQQQMLLQELGMIEEDLMNGGMDAVKDDETSSFQFIYSDNSSLGHCIFPDTSAEGAFDSVSVVDTIQYGEKPRQTVRANEKGGTVMNVVHVMAPFNDKQGLVTPPVGLRDNPNCTDMRVHKGQHIKVPIHVETESTKNTKMFASYGSRNFGNPIDNAVFAPFVVTSPMKTDNSTPNIKYLNKLSDKYSIHHPSPVSMTTGNTVIYRIITPRIDRWKKLQRQKPITV